MEAWVEGTVGAAAECKMITKGQYSPHTWKIRNILRMETKTKKGERL